MENKMESIYPYIDKFIKEHKATLSYADKFYVVTCPTRDVIYAPSLDTLDRHLQIELLDLDEVSYQVHYNRQLLMKVLAHVIALDLSEDKLMGYGELTMDRSIVAFLSDVNIHIAKVHFTQDEINDIAKILEESKKFI